jgi:hypothetical protein
LEAAKHPAVSGARRCSPMRALTANTAPVRVGIAPTEAVRFGGVGPAVHPILVALTDRRDLRGGGMGPAGLVEGRHDGGLLASGSMNRPSHLRTTEPITSTLTVADDLR